jgi:hypothetical protein
VDLRLGSPDSSELVGFDEGDDLRRYRSSLTPSHLRWCNPVPGADVNKQILVHCNFIVVQANDFPLAVDFLPYN